MTSVVEPISRPATDIDQDAAIAEALRTFVCSLGPAAADVRLEYAAGAVTVAGVVASTVQRQGIEDLLLAHDGVESVANELRVAPAGVRAGRS